ncbi:MAG: Gfo/Idh/MocA family protein [Candidatus Neomarinimicrobiota bacterium]
MEPQRVGIVGYGGFGQFLHYAWASCERVRIVAAADSDPLRNPGPPVRFFTRWEDLVAAPGIELVAVATPPRTHADIACEAMQQGKHILVEKPLAVTRQEARRVIETRDRTGMVAGIDYMLRFNPLVEAITALTHEGSLGALRRAVVENYAQDEVLPPEHWFWDRSRSGGIFVEHGVHFFDLINNLAASSPRNINGACHQRNERQEDRAVATVAYEDGLMATHYHAFSRPGFFEQTFIRLVYDLAEIDLEGWIPLSGRVRALVNQATEGNLHRLPGFRIVHKVDIEDVEDLSRPEGWGRKRLDTRREGMITSGGRSYQADSLITGTFAAAGSKGQVYTDSLRRLLADLLDRIEDSRHVMRVGLEEGLSSLDMALWADQAARVDQAPVP